MIALVSVLLVVYVLGVASLFWTLSKVDIFPVARPVAHSMLKASMALGWPIIFVGVLTGLITLEDLE